MKNDSSIALLQGISRLTRGASIEMNYPDIKHLEASKDLLAPGTKVFVSHLPGQTWEQTLEASIGVQRAGFTPVAHIPARLMPDKDTLDRCLAHLAEQAQAQEVLLIAGDYPKAEGPYSSVSDILKTELLNKRGFKRVSLAGHPEGHTKVDLAVIRQAQRDKVRLATSMGLDTSLVTQFFFESAPFVDWAAELRQEGISAHLVAGIAGPASMASLFKFAVRCGVGPSIRALGAKPSAFLKLLGDYGPESLVAELAQAQMQQADAVSGLHLFCFGGFLRTSKWLQAVSQGRFQPDEKGSFKVDA